MGKYFIEHVYTPIAWESMISCDRCLQSSGGKTETRLHHSRSVWSREATRSLPNKGSEGDYGKTKEPLKALLCKDEVISTKVTASTSFNRVGTVA